MFDYSDGKLSTPYDGQTIQLAPITAEQDAQYQQWMRELGFGFSDDDAAGYNINDKDINATNWRDQAGLYIYDGVGTDVTDEKGRTGYTAVYFPWYKGGVVNSNLDPTFCDDITPEKGWEWVLNLCGDRTIQNNNFFALYNKYSGILRFFYYMPASFTSGDDHMWEVHMTDKMAQRSVYGYGLPLDLNITNKAALNQTYDNFFADYITPYVRSLAPDGKITPNSGWWAFDIDMSLYRPDDNSFGDGQSVSLQMRSWRENHVSLTSAVTGKLSGDIKMDQTKTYTVVSKSKGLLGIFKDVVSVGKAAVGTITSAKSGNVGAAIKNGIGLAKSGYTLYGDVTKKSSSTTYTDTLSNLTGTINCSFDATAETAGTISTSTPVTGVASPTIPGKNFITAGTGVGDGVWNIKSSPVVYYFNKSMDYNHYCLTFFDPSSIEVVLNPDVFPESDIEWVEVDALSGVRKEGTGKCREAFGIPYSLDVSGGFYGFPMDFLVDYYWGFDFFYKLDDKQGMEYVHNQKYGNKQHISGRSVPGGEYFVEPYVTWGLPQTEVNVVVTVKLRNMDAPILLSRPYIPVVKPVNIDIGNIEDFVALYNQIVSKPKKNWVTTSS